MCGSNSLFGFHKSVLPCDGRGVDLMMLAFDAQGFEVSAYVERHTKPLVRGHIVGARCLLISCAVASDIVSARCLLDVFHLS